MKVLLISANREEINMRTWPLGLACVAAATEAAGHVVKVVDLMAERDPHTFVKKAIEDLSPGLIGISVRNIDDQSMEASQFLLEKVREVVEECRADSEAPVVLGGAGYSIYPESCLEYLGADMGIQGEGEMVFPELIRRIEEGSDLSGLPGLYLPGRGLQANRVFVKDLDQLPLPDPGSFALPSCGDDEFWLPVQTRRGCPMRCSYCSTALIEGCSFRRRSPEKVVQWLTRWAQAGVRRFHFVDNTFNLPTSYAKALCSKLAEADLEVAWRCILYPTRIDEALVKLMARTGCKEVSLGFESGSVPILRAMNKRFGPNDIRRASALLARHGIRRIGFLLLGGPGETRETAEESLLFADSLKLEVMKVTVGIRIYPDTLLARTAVEEGVISKGDDLLVPKFYVAPGLADWLHETVRDWMTRRPNWMC
jgi:radical SAM superfamily enzyme YgiQ (UPF0313 family)